MNCCCLLNNDKRPEARTTLACYREARDDHEKALNEALRSTKACLRTVSVGYLRTIVRPLFLLRSKKSTLTFTYEGLVDSNLRWEI
jgi:hypothetical protein